MTTTTDNRARLLAVHFHRALAEWKRMQYEPIDNDLIRQATEQFISDLPASARDGE